MLTGCALSLLPARAAAEPESTRLLVVVSKTSSLRDLPLTELRAIYLGKRRTAGGETLIPFNHPPGTQDRVGFDRTVLHMSPEEVGRFWVDQKIRGGGSPPRTVDSVAILVRLIQKLPGAIGYVHEGIAIPDLLPLAIDGKPPSHPDYPVRYS